MTSAVRNTLIKDLKGKTISVHDLGSLLPGWSAGVSPDVENLREKIEAKLDTYECFFTKFALILHIVVALV